MTKIVAIGTSSFADGDPAPLELLRSKDIEVRPNPWGRRLTEDEAITHFRGADGILAGLEPLTRRVLAASQPTVRAIVRIGAGTANVDFAAAAELGIAVSSTPDAPTEAVAEMTVGALLAITRRIVASSNAMHRREWTKMIGSGLGGATVLIVGFGRIGRRVAQLLHAFRARILVVDPAVTTLPVEFGHCELVDLMTGLKAADIVSLHASGSVEVLSAAHIAAMKRGVTLLNSARGELVNETALIAAIQDGHVGAAWFDAFTIEPYAGGLCDLPQVLLTPHVATYTRQCRSEMELDAVRQLFGHLGIAAGNE